MTDLSHEKIDAARALLRRAAREFAPATFANSLGAEDMVLTDLIFRDALPIEVFTLDTGRLPNETYALLDAIAARYGARPRVLFPRSEAVEAYVTRHGVNGFYNSVELRKACCHIRKVEPLRRALASKKAWISAAPPARARSPLAKTSGPGAGGGSELPPRSAGCIPARRASRRPPERGRLPSA